jgi:hypothetical protein
VETEELIRLFVKTYLTQCGGANKVSLLIHSDQTFTVRSVQLQSVVAGSQQDMGFFKADATPVGEFSSFAAPSLT